MRKRHKKVRCPRCGAKHSSIRIYSAPSARKEHNIRGRVLVCSCGRGMDTTPFVRIGPKEFALRSLWVIERDQHAYVDGARIWTNFIGSGLNDDEIRAEIAEAREPSVRLQIPRLKIARASRGSTSVREANHVRRTN